MRIVNFENLLHMKPYSLLILNKVQTHKKNSFKALKTTKLVLFFKRYIHDIVMYTILPQIVRQQNAQYWPDPKSSDIFFSLLIIYLWGPHEDSQGGVEVTPCQILFTYICITSP